MSVSDIARSPVPSIEQWVTVTGTLGTTSTPYFVPSARAGEVRDGDIYLLADTGNPSVAVLLVFKSSSPPGKAGSTLTITCELETYDYRGYWLSWANQARPQLTVDSRVYLAAPFDHRIRTFDWIGESLLFLVMDGFLLWMTRQSLRWTR